MKEDHTAEAKELREETKTKKVMNCEQDGGSTRENKL
jgi:hypothetical protein